jgi:hypothetical protein
MKNERLTLRESVEASRKNATRRLLYLRIGATWGAMVLLSLVVGVGLFVMTGNSVLVNASYAGMGITIVAVCLWALITVWFTPTNAVMMTHKRLSVAWWIAVGSLGALVLLAFMRGLVLSECTDPGTNRILAHALSAGMVLCGFLIGRLSRYPRLRPDGNHE